MVYIQMQPLQETRYHQILRISSVVCACVLLFQSGIVHTSTALWTNSAQEYLASAVGMSAAVPPTELNQYTAALTSWESDLERREAAVQEREIALRQAGIDPSGSSYRTFILSAVLFIILVLLVLNYVLDFLRAREVNPERSPFTPLLE